MQRQSTSTCSYIWLLQSEDPGPNGLFLRKKMILMDIFAICKECATATSCCIELDLCCCCAIKIFKVFKRISTQLPIDYNFPIPSYELIDSWICSSVFPLVSGTNLATNTIVANETPAYRKNVPEKNRTLQMSQFDKASFCDPCIGKWYLPDELQFMRKLKV